jgi:hypothetical protein
MTSSNTLKGRLAGYLALSVLLSVFWAGPIFSHCDSQDGPIIPLIRESLDSGEITPLLKWLAPEDEAEIKALFDQVRAVRGQSDETREVADRLFIETFIRLHRASEGASFTGIKPAGTTPPIFAQLDQALATGEVDALADRIAAEVREGITTRFNHAVELEKHQDESVAAGREYVEAYVTYMHFVEGLHEYLSSGGPVHGSPEGSGHGH